MEREQHLVVRVHLEARMLDGGRDGADVGGIVVVVVDEVARHVPVRFLERCLHAVGHRARGGIGALRVQRQRDEARAARLLERAHAREHRRVAVAHGAAHHGVQPLVVEGGAQSGGQLLVRDGERRSLVGPYLRVLLGRRDAALRQNEQMEDEPPPDAVHGRDALVHEKLGKIFPHGAGPRHGGRACVHQEHPGAFPFSHLVHHLPAVFHRHPLRGATCKPTIKRTLLKRPLKSDIV